MNWGKAKNISHMLIVGGLFLCCTSCANLDAVREWSKTSLEATQFNEVVATYADTPERLKRYDSIENWKKQAEIRKKQAEALKKLLSVVSDYMAALTTLSADSTVDYSKNVDQFTSSIEKLNVGVSATTLGAAGSLTKTVLNAAARAYQAEQVTKIVEEANEPLQLLLSGELRKVVDNDFRRDLSVEKSLIDGYYKRLVRNGNPSEAAIDAVREWQEVRLRQNEKRLMALDAYLKVVDSVAVGHQKLYDNRHKLDAKALIKELYTLANEMRKQIKILTA